MNIETTIDRVRSRVQMWKQDGGNIALVPTMGALHRGHLSLVECAREHANYVVLSVFVNPLQFGSKEDLGLYPRTLESDIELANKAGVNLVFAPTITELFADNGGVLAEEKKDSRCGDASFCLVKAASRSLGLCGRSRPGHFDGVVTVVSLLFNIIQPNCAVFGEKDYQQLKVIEQLVHDLHFPVKIIGAPLIRDNDGLALSSRNVRLSPEDRFHALVISKTLFKAQELVAGGEKSVLKIRELVLFNLEKAGGLRVDYVEIVNVETLAPLDEICGVAQLLVAAYVGSVRLIDNIRLGKNKQS